MNGVGRLGLLGGTLDPIHLGHLETARAARAALALDRVIVLPSRVPPHRTSQPVASRYHRFAMTALAVNGAEGLRLSDMELCAPGPSYTADTLTRFRERFGLDRSQIFFITGADAFAEIATWHRYPEVLDLAQLRRGLAARVRDRDIARAAAGACRTDGHRAGCGRHRLVDRDAASLHGYFSRECAGHPTCPPPKSAGASLRGDARPDSFRHGGAHILQHGLYTAHIGTSHGNHLHGEN